MILSHVFDDLKIEPSKSPESVTVFLPEKKTGQVILQYGLLTKT
jgi:hypothetical protein